MNPLPAGFVPYVSRFPWWVDQLLLELDYFWFLALLGWGLVLVLWWWHPRRETSANAAWAWLPWSAGAGIVAALTEFTLLNSNAGPPPKTWQDIGLGLLPLLAAAGWWQAAAAPARGRRILAALTTAPLVMIGAYRYHNPLAGGWATVAATLVAIIPWWRKPGADFCSRTALMLAALTPLFAAVGPLAVRAHFYQPFLLQNVSVLWAGAYHALTACIALLFFTRAVVRSLTAVAHRELWPEFRPFLIGGALWAATCLAIGAITSRDQLFAGRRYVLEQVQRVVVQLDQRALAATLGPEFQLDPQSLPKGNRDARMLTAEAPHLATGVGEPLYRALSDVARGSRGGLKAVSILTIRDGWLVVALSSNRFEQPARVRLARPIQEDDQLRWDQRMEIIESPISFNAGGMDLMRAPLLAADGAMLGWLEFAQARGGYAPFRARTAPFIATVLGLVVTALFFVQRQNLRERETALRAAAVAAESARAKSEFLAKVSHELRTPLQTILGYGELMKSDVSGVHGRARLQSLHQQGQLMLRVVNDLIDLNAIEMGVFRFVEQPVALGALVQQTTESLRPRMMEKNLALHVTIDPRLPPWVRSDGERLRQIVLNLVGNAVKFTERGGVEVAVRVIEQDATRCAVELAVRDTGPGIALAEQARLFQAFSRVGHTTAAEGSGLGLALVAALCRSAGGNVTVESDGRSGTCFRVRLPVAPDVAPKPAAAPAPTTLRGRQVLIADDNALVRELFATYLREQGATCDEAANGEQALAQGLEGSYDVIVLDVAMPGIDGLEVTRRLRMQAAGANVRIVGVSAHAGAADRERALAAGMNAFLVKPVELPELAAALSIEPVASLASNRRAAIQSALEDRFRAGLADEVAALRQVWAQQNWSEVKTRAHYLKSGASVVRDDALYAACGALEDAAERDDGPAVQAAWTSCEAALRRWA